MWCVSLKLLWMAPLPMLWIGFNSFCVAGKQIGWKSQVKMKVKLSFSMHLCECVCMCVTHQSVTVAYVTVLPASATLIKLYIVHMLLSMVTLNFHSWSLILSKCATAVSFSPALVCICMCMLIGVCTCVCVHFNLSVYVESWVCTEAAEQSHTAHCIADTWPCVAWHR